LRRGVFVTGTGTGVGKTTVTRGVVRALVRRGVNVAALKPVESGVKDVGDRSSDAAVLMRSSGWGETFDDVCAYRLDDSVSPHLAARRQGVRIDPERLHALLRRAGKSADLVIAEGAGGLLVPLSDDLLYADFIATTGYRILIVAPNALGAIHATLATVEAARTRGIEAIGVVLNGTPQTDFDNAAAIERFGRVRILGCFPTVGANDDDDLLADAAEASIDLRALVPLSEKERQAR
jgi:dethiobiotin synthetase